MEQILFKGWGYKCKSIMSRNSPKFISWCLNSKGQSHFVVFLSLLGSILSSSILLVICITFSGYKRWILGKSASMRSYSSVCDGWKAPPPWFAAYTCHRSWGNFVILLSLRERTKGLIWETTKFVSHINPLDASTSFPLVLFS